MIEKRIRPTYAKGLNDLATILQIHRLSVSPDDLGAAHRHKREVLIKRMPSLLFARSAELQIGSAHTPLLERAARMPQLNHLRIRSQRHAADHVRGVIEEDDLGCCCLFQHSGAVETVSGIGIAVLVKRNVLDAEPRIGAQASMQNLKAVRQRRLLRFNEQHLPLFKRSLGSPSINARKPLIQHEVLDLLLHPLHNPATHNRPIPATYIFHFMTVFPMLLRASASNACVIWATEPTSTTLPTRAAK